jgi:hypothetical protein
MMKIMAQRRKAKKNPLCIRKELSSAMSVCTLTEESSNKADEVPLSPPRMIQRKPNTNDTITRRNTLITSSDAMPTGMGKTLTTYGNAMPGKRTTET